MNSREQVDVVGLRFRVRIAVDLINTTMMVKPEGVWHDDEVELIVGDEATSVNRRHKERKRRNSDRATPTTEETDKKNLRIVANGGHSHRLDDNVTEVVAQFTHNRLRKLADAVFVEHSRRTGHNNEERKFYTLQSDVNDNVLHLGTEDNSKRQGFDYALAFVNKRTGKVTYQPTKLFQFEAKYTQDKALLLGEKIANKADYSQDFSDDKEAWRTKRRTLTAEFGSKKKIKLQDAAQRREIKEETLQAMSFSIPSSSTLNADNDMKPDIAMLRTTDSSVLPKANNEAELAKDVYSWELFIKDGDLETLGPIAVELLQTPKLQLIEAGYAPLVMQLIGNLPTEETAKQRRAFCIVLLATMHHFCMVISRHTKKFITMTEMANFPMPHEFVTKLRCEYFTEAMFNKQQRGPDKLRVNISSTDKDRLLSHMLVLALLLDVGSYTLPVTPWSRSLKISDQKLTTMLRALGCNVVPATKSEGLMLQTTKIARLVGPPGKAAGKFKRPLKGRRTM